MHELASVFVSFLSHFSSVAITTHQSTCGFRFTVTIQFMFPNTFDAQQRRSRETRCLSNQSCSFLFCGGVRPSNCFCTHECISLSPQGINGHTAVVCVFIPASADSFAYFRHRLCFSWCVHRMACSLIVDGEVSQQSRYQSSKVSPPVRSLEFRRV